MEIPFCPAHNTHIGDARATDMRWLRTSTDHDALLWFGATQALTPLREEPIGDPEPEMSPWGT